MPKATATKRSVRLQIPVAGDTRDNLRANLREALARGDTHVIFDCAASTQLEVRMVSALIQCAAECRERGATFEVANMPSEVRSHILACGLEERVGMSE